MKIRVRLFASYAQLAGFRERELDLPAGTTAGDVLARLRMGPLAILPSSARPLFAVNAAHVPASQLLGEGDEVGIFPPVSGGSGAAGPFLLVSANALPVEALTASVRGPGCGAVLVFEGTVRDENEGEAVSAVEYDAYVEMATSQLAAIHAELLARWPSARVAMAHRTGRLEVGETSVVVACAAPHRREAFAACRFGMDRIKESLPVWKREIVAEGKSRWL